MTTRTSQDIICVCGHEGTLNCSENDAPYSAMYERYKLSGFDGEEVVYTSMSQMMSGSTLEKTKPKCPKCGEIGKVSFKKP